jgi:hypothetical protein
MKFLFLLFMNFCLLSYTAFSLDISSSDIIVDSDMTFAQAIEGTSAPKDVLAKLELLNVDYYSFDKKLHRGQLLIHKELVNEVKSIFALMKERKFPIAKVVPIVKYGWSDDKSMSDNNTSAFNYRKVARKDKLSNHSFGYAIDFNPMQNPAVYNDGTSSPEGSKYDKSKPGTVSSEHFLTLEFKRLGWTWGGDWNSLKDYQHLEKIIK